MVPARWNRIFDGGPEMSGWSTHTAMHSGQVPKLSLGAVASGNVPMASGPMRSL